MENNKTKIRRVDRPQNISGYFGEEKYLLSLLELETLFLVRPARIPVTLATNKCVLGVDEQIILKWISKLKCGRS
jgi:hypothetical protein